MDIQKVWNYNTASINTVIIPYLNKNSDSILQSNELIFYSKFSYAVRYKYCTKDVSIQS